RVAADAGSVDGGMERLGVSGAGDWGIGLVVVSSARGRYAGSRPYGTNGADSDGAPELLACRIRRGGDEELVRNRDELAEGVQQDLAGFDDRARNSAGRLSRVVRGVQEPLRETPGPDLEGRGRSSFGPQDADPAEHDRHCRRQRIDGARCD